MGTEKPYQLQPITLKEAHRFVKLHHRHHQPAQGGLFAVAVNNRSEVVGVAVVGRPVSRHLDTGWAAEVTRLCVLENLPKVIGQDGKEHASPVVSMLYKAAWRACKALGYRRLITYVLLSEDGTSLRAAGFERKGAAGGGSWNKSGRPRVDTHPIEQKSLWEVAA